MDPTRFDRIATLLAQRRLSRRQALQQGSVGLAAGLAAAALAVTGLGGTEVAAQEATPAPTPAPGASPAKPTTFMFVQSFAGGALVPQPGHPGHYTLTLPHGLGQTIYFSDRPERVVGIVPTAQFLKGQDFSVTNPPNAVLIGHQSPTHEDLVVLELFNLRYDPTTNTATYDAHILKDTHRLDMVYTQTPDQEEAAPRTYTDAHLFIDDCPDGFVACYTQDGGWKGDLGPHGQCWNWGRACCEPCASSSQDYWNALCNQTYPLCSAVYPDNCYAALGGDWFQCNGF